MPLMTWKPQFSVDVPVLDRQHQRLIALLNELGDAMAAGKGNDVTGTILTKLVSYTKTHFADEERLMGEAGYAGLAAHKVEHETLARQVVEFQRKLESGTTTMSVQLTGFLKQWLQDHIVGVDKKYAACLKAKVGATATV